MKNIKGFFYIKHENFLLNTTFNINSKKIIALIGESGSGKTTFLKCISGLIKPNKSYLEINNKVIQDSKKNIFINTNKRNIGYVFQTPCLFPHITVFDNIISGKNKSKKKYIEINYRNIINYLNLEKLLKRRIVNLSGGEIQRVSIAQIILMQPCLILLDEAFSAQDINMKQKLIMLFKHINNKFNVPIIYVSHDIKSLNKLTNNIIYLNNGKIKNIL